MSNAPPESALQRELPQLAETLPSIPLGTWPTPVRRLRRLGERLGIELWVKADDQSAEAYGGNKVRKLELLLAEARQRGARRLLTVGGIGSHQIIATAVHGAAALQLPTRAVVVPQPATEHVIANLAFAQDLGVELLPCERRLSVPLALRRAKDADTYTLGPGGSSPLGTVGYLLAALELRRQIDAGELPSPDAIVVPLGSGGTTAGLWLGLTAAGLDSELIAVRVVERSLCNGWLVRLLARRCQRLLARHGHELSSRRGALIVDHGHAGPRYGAPTEAALLATEVAAGDEGLHLETTYSGKAMAALIARSAPPGRPRRFLFWNTHGARLEPQTVKNKTLSTLPDKIQGWIDADRSGQRSSAG